MHCYLEKINLYGIKYIYKYKGVDSTVGPKDYDRTSTNDDGQKFYGHDDGDGRTDWYTEDGSLDSSTPTPSDDDEW